MSIHLRLSSNICRLLQEVVDAQTMEAVDLARAKILSLDLLAHSQRALVGPLAANASSAAAPTLTASSPVAAPPTKLEDDAEQNLSVLWSQNQQVLETTSKSQPSIPPAKLKRLKPSAKTSASSKSDAASSAATLTSSAATQAASSYARLRIQAIKAKTKAKAKARPKLTASAKPRPPKEPEPKQMPKRPSEPAGPQQPKTAPTVLQTHAEELQRLAQQWEEYDDKPLESMLEEQLSLYHANNPQTCAVTMTHKNQPTKHKSANPRTSTSKKTSTATARSLPSKKRSRVRGGNHGSKCGGGGWVGWQWM